MLYFCPNLKNCSCRCQKAVLIPLAGSVLRRRYEHVVLQLLLTFKTSRMCSNTTQNRFGIIKGIKVYRLRLVVSSQYLYMYIYIYTHMYKHVRIGIYIYMLVCSYIYLQNICLLNICMVNIEMW